MPLLVNELEITSGEMVEVTGKYSFVKHAEQDSDNGRCNPLPAEFSITLMKNQPAPKLFMCQHDAIWKLETA